MASSWSFAAEHDAPERAALTGFGPEPEIPPPFGVSTNLHPSLTASTALDVTRDLCSASRTEPSKNQIATLYGAAEIDYRRASSTLPAPNIRQHPLTELLRYSLPEVLRLVTKALRRRVALSNWPQFRSWSIFHRSISNVSLSYFAANTLHDVELVGIDHLDLGFIANKCCNADVCQRRAQLHIVRPKFPCGTPFFQCVTGIEEPCDRRIQIEAGALTQFPKQEAAVVKVSGLGP